MLKDGLRNIALLSGFAWRQGEQWFLLQRAPLPMGLPFELAPGAREPEQGEAVDLFGHVVNKNGTLRMEVIHVARAARTSIPHRLQWLVPKVPQAFDSGIGRVVDTHGELLPAIAATLIETPDIPDAMREDCERDPTLRQWAAGTESRSRLLNRVMLTGFVGAIVDRVTHNGNVYYSVALHVAAPPVAPIMMRLTQDMPAFFRVKSRLRSWAPIPVTVTGQFHAKVRPNDDDPHKTRAIEYYLRMSDVVAVDPTDLDGTPAWLPEWRGAARAHTAAF